MTRKRASDQVMTKIRPQSIIWFERLFFGSLALGYLLLIGVSAIALDNLGIEIITLGCLVLLWYFIAHRASNVAKWIDVAVVAFGVANMVTVIQQLSNVQMALSLAANLFAFASIICLFTPSARIWFQSKGQAGNGNDDQFRTF